MSETISDELRKSLRNPEMSNALLAASALIAKSAQKAERERCAMIAQNYYEWHKPDYPEYCDGDPAADIAAKIRSGE